jgi:uncharacterized DUF497 family protein
LINKVHLDISGSLNYIKKKGFEWDEDKNSECKKLRGFQFQDITHAFLDPHQCITPDTRHDYGEERFELLAKHDEILFVVIYTFREEAIRIISARKANEREKKRYKNHAHYG